MRFNSKTFVTVNPGTEKRNYLIKVLVLFLQSYLCAVLPVRIAGRGVKLHWNLFTFLGTGYRLGHTFFQFNKLKV